MVRLRTKQVKFLELLRKLELEKRELSNADFGQLVQNEVGYKDGAKTYRSKILDGKLIFESDREDTIHVRNAVTMSDESFATLMSQRKTDPLKVADYSTEEGWREALRNLIWIGIDNNYRLEADDDDFLEEIAAKPK